MKERSLILSTIKEKFPHQHKRIDELFEQDQDFQVLCGDYISCLISLRKYQMMRHEQAKDIQEVDVTLKELEKELYELICE